MTSVKQAGDCYDWADDDHSTHNQTPTRPVCGSDAAWAHPMRRLTSCCLMWALWTCLCTGPQAMAQINGKIGYVNWEELLQSAPQIQSVKNQLTAEFESRKDQITEDEDRLSQFEEQLIRDSDLMSDTVRVETERRIRELRRKVQRDKEDLRVELDYRLDTKRQQVEDEIYNVVRLFAQENSYDLIIPGPALYASDSINLTEQLLERLQLSFEAQQESAQ